jgi:hypothetical protein
MSPGTFATIPCDISAGLDNFAVACYIAASVFL